MTWVEHNDQSSWALEQMMRQIALSIEADMNVFPTLLPFPYQLHQPYQPTPPPATEVEEMDKEEDEEEQ